MTSTPLIVIPARYGSTRFPGKPLAMIAGQTMLARVVETARRAETNADILVATEDERIRDHCAEIGVDCVITPADCPTGSDRVLAALKESGSNADVIVNLQGDAPFTPPEAIRAVTEAFARDPEKQVITPVMRLRWADMDRLRDSKKRTPFSGTCATVDVNGKALWFSKNVIPAIRKEDALREKSAFSPVLRHIGLYGWRKDTLERFVALPQSPYEQLEGLEQLRLLENGIPVHTVEISLPEGPLPPSGIDSPEDVKRAETFFKEHITPHSSKSETPDKPLSAKQEAGRSGVC